MSHKMAVGSCKCVGRGRNRRRGCMTRKGFRFKGKC